MIRSLPTWTENVGKRVRKAPKIYLRDSGLFHALQRIPSLSDLQAHPKIGASWEGLALAGSAPGPRRSAVGLRVQVRRRAPHDHYALDDRIRVIGLRSVEQLGDATGRSLPESPRRT